MRDSRRGIWNILKIFFPAVLLEKRVEICHFVGLGCMPTVPPNLVMAHRRKNTLQHTKIRNLSRQQQRRRLIYRRFNFTGDETVGRI
jgi:hypothetical protein